MSKSRILSLVVTAHVLTLFTVDATVLYWTSFEGYTINGVKKSGVFKVDTQNSKVDIIVDTGYNVADSLLIDSQGRIIYDLQSGEVHRVNIDGSKDEILADVQTIKQIESYKYIAKFALQDMAIEPGGNRILVSDFENGQILVIDLTKPLPNAAILASVPSPNGITFDKAGNLFVFGGFRSSAGANLYWLGNVHDADYGNPNNLPKNVSAAFDRPEHELDGLVFDPNTNRLFGTSRKSGRLWKIDQGLFMASAKDTYDPVTPWHTFETNNGDKGPDGLMTNLKGQLYIANRHDYTIWVCDADKAPNCKKLAGAPVLDGLDDVAQLAIDPPEPTKTFTPNRIRPNGISQMKIVVANPNPGVALLNVTAKDQLPSVPAQMTVANPANLTVSCGTASINNKTLIDWTIGDIAKGVSCTLTVDVTAPLSSTIAYHNVVKVTSSNGGDSEASADLNVVDEPDLTKSFNPSLIQIAGQTVASLRIDNRTGVDATRATLTDTLPPGMFFVQPPAVSNQCGGSCIVNGQALSCTELSILKQTSCTVSFPVVSNIAGTGSQKGDPNFNCAVLNGVQEACAPLIVEQLPPVIVKSFVPDTIPVNGISVMTLTIRNPNPVGTLNEIGFTDDFPAGLTLANSPDPTNGCGGTLTFPTIPPPTIRFSGGSRQAGQPCTITVKVTARKEGTYCNQTSPISAALTHGGLPSNIACLRVTPSASDVFQMHYAANLDIGDAAVVITNAGSLSGSDPEGRICANVYAFNPNEELIACCACMVTPNGLSSLSVFRDIVSLSLTGLQPSSVLIKLLASKPAAAGNCDPTTPNSLNLVSGMRAWGTSLHAKSSYPITYGSTETEFVKPELSAAELAKLTTYCQFAKILGSQVSGICKSCQPGALGAAGR